jgi:hypothetical protein
MIAEQLSHLPILGEDYAEKPRRVYEVATIRQFRGEPIRLSVIGLYHYPGNNPLGAGNCELPTPDSVEDFLVYAGDRSHYEQTGETWVIVPTGKLYAARQTVPVGQITATDLCELDRYRSGDVRVRIRPPRPTKPSLAQVVRTLFDQSSRRLAIA